MRDDRHTLSPSEQMQCQGSGFVAVAETTELLG